MTINVIKALRRISLLKEALKTLRLNFLVSLFILA
jgi:hypothetical protein